jgi:hypothetical protein
MAMTAQEYLDTFNAAINAGAYDSAANILKAAEGDFGPGVYDVAGVVLESNASLPPEIDFMTPQGIQSIRDYVNTATAPPPASSAEIQRMQAQRAEAELLRLREAERPIVDPRRQPTVDPVAQKYVNDFNALIDQGNYDGAARLVKEAELAGYGDEAYRAAAVALDANTNLPPELNFLNAEGIASIKSFVEEATRPPPPAPAATVAKSFDEQLNELANQNFGRSLTASEMDTYRRDYGGELNDANISDFLKRSQTEIDQVKTARDIATKATDTAAANAEGRPGPDQIFGIPRFERQTQSNVPFAPLRRGLAQLRPAAFMPGLTSGQAPLGGSGFTPESLRNAIKSMTAAGQTPADVAYQMDIGGVSPAELSAAIGTPVGQIQGAYNQSRPRGLFSTGVPAPRDLPEDFVLQTGAYGAPTPTFLNRNATAAGGTAAGPAGVDQPTYAQLLDNVQRLSAQVQPLINRGQVDYGDGEGIEGDPNSSGFSFSGFGFGDESGSVGPAGGGPSGDGPGDESGGSVGSDGGPSGDGPGDGPGGVKMGGLIRMAEGGGPPKMAELFVEDMGSTFDIDDYIKEGILVGGMSKPIRDAYGKIIGYESGDLPLPIQRDVVFGKELRDKEAAMRLTDAEREQMMVEMAMRQGRTGISPTRGGLAGIEIGDPMMRRRPQYYSTVEQFRPRYAEGGIASVAQNLADKGRKGDSMLVHMTPDEVAGLQALAQQMGGSLTINPQTGLPEANIFKKLLPMALGFALGPAGFGVFQSALTTGLAVGAGYTLATGSLQQGLAAGLGAYGGSNLGTGLQAAGTADAATSAAASDAASSGLQVAGGAGGATAEAAMVNPMAHPDFAGTA